MRIRGRRRSVTSRATRLLLCVALPTLCACGLLFPTALSESASDGGSDSDASDATAEGGGGGEGGSEASSEAGAEASAEGGGTDAEDGAVSPEASSSADAGSDVVSDAVGDAAIDAVGDAVLGDGGCTASIATDPLNCGACGHDCLGGACEGGVCAPVAILSGEPAPAYIATDGNKVYWTAVGTNATNGNGIFSAGVDGSNKASVLTPLAFANQLVLRGSILYYDSEFNGSVGQYDFGSGTNTTFAGSPTATPYSPTGLGVLSDGGALYWLAQLDEGGVSVRGQQLPSGPQTVLTWDSEGKLGQCLGADNSGVFFTAGAGLTVQNLKHIGPGGCPDASACGVVVHGAPNISALALGGTFVYWAEENQYAGMGTISRRAKDLDAGGFGVIVSNAMYPNFLLVDGNYLYWTEFAPATSDAGPTGAVGRVALTGPANKTYLATGQGYPLGMASDGRAIYWINRGTLTDKVNGIWGLVDGQVMRLAK